MDIPPSMRAELGKWNGGNGIDMEGWIGCQGSFSLAVGYITLFWPEFELNEGYIFHKGVSRNTIRGFESQPNTSRLSVEATINHIHLIDIQYGGCPDASADKLLALGNALKEIYEAKLKQQFPDRPCAVRFYVPENVDDLRDYELTFWQVTHERSEPPLSV